MKHRKLAFIDLETTGLDPQVHEIIELGAVIVDQNTLEELESFEIKVKPKSIETADPEALAVNHYNPQDWVFAVDLKPALEHFIGKVRGTIIVAHNLFFDWAFLEQAMRQEGLREFDHRKLDLFSIAWAKLHSDEWAEKFSLRALCEYLGVQNPRAHTALSDARTAHLVFKKLMR